jgi:ribosomal protein S18 acetylase RimI-like enzyme
MPLEKLTEKNHALVQEWRALGGNGPDSSIYDELQLTLRGSASSVQDKDSVLDWYIHIDDSGEHNAAVCFRSRESNINHVFMSICLSDRKRSCSNLQVGFAAMDQAFQVSKFHKVSMDLDSKNESHIRLLKKLGFQVEGEFESDYFDGKDYIDIKRLGILGTKWMEVREEVKGHIDQLEALSTQERKNFTIVILCDLDSWLLPYLYDLVEEWRAMGHRCEMSHEASGAVPADFCFCLSFSQIVPSSIRRQFKNTLVVHESELPQGRGWSPMSWQILAGSSRIPVTLIEAEDAVDTGRIYLQEWIELEGSELSADWRAKQARCTTSLCKRWVENYPASVETAREQQGDASYFEKRERAHSELDPNLSIVNQFELLRVVDNKRYPAFFNIRGQLYRLLIEKDSE